MLSGWWLALLAAGRLGLNFAIRRSLRAARTIEVADPGDLPWRQVCIPTVKDKRLSGWFIPAADQAPAPR